MKLSAAIITFNEEKNIGRCIDSLEGIADEVVVLDSFSGDQTEAICKEKGVIFLQNKFPGHIEQKSSSPSRASRPSSPLRIAVKRLG